MDFREIRTLGDYLSVLPNTNDSLVPIFYSKVRITGSANHLDHRKYYLDFERMAKASASEVAIILCNSEGYEFPRITISKMNHLCDSIVGYRPRADADKIRRDDELNAIESARLIA